MNKLLLPFLFFYFLVNHTWGQNRIIDAIPLPKNAKRELATGFGDFLQKYPLLGGGAQVHYFSGEISPLDEINGGVLDIEVGNRDLLQCADAIMYLYAHYQKKIGKINNVAFHFVNGTLCDYKSYKSGYRFADNQWQKTAAASQDDSQFNKYLNLVYAYASTLSLEKELKKVSRWEDLKVGDVFIRGGSPGHCFIIVDKMKDANGKVFFALAQGFMPAQSVHLISRKSGYWFEVGKNHNDIPYGEIISLNYLKSF